MSERVRLPANLLPQESIYLPVTRGRLGALSPRGKTGTYALLIVVGVIAALFWQHTLALVSEVWFWVAVSAAVLWWLVSRVRAMHAMVKENQDAITLLEGSRLEEGARRLDVLCRKSSWVPNFHAFFVYNRGVGYLREGQPNRALSLFAAALDSGWFEVESNSFYVYYPQLLNGIATCYAIIGDIAAAERWQGLAHDAITTERLGMLVPLDTLVGIRCGRYEIVVSDAEANWESAEAALPAPGLKCLRILCAFSLSQVNQNNVHDDRIRRFLDGAYPFRVGQFDWMAVNWPELKVFLQYHDFSLPALAAASSEIRPQAMKK